MNPTNWFTQRKTLPLALIACILLAVIIVKTRPSMQPRIQKASASFIIL